MRCRRHRRFRNIDDEHVVTRLRAIAEDRERAAIEDATAKDGDHPSLTMRVLSRTVHVGIPHHGCVHPVYARIVREVVLGAQLRDAVWRLGVLRIVLDVGRLDEISIQCSARGGEDKACPRATPTLPQRLDEVQCAADVDARIKDRIRDALPDIESAE